ncbi:hypothetical protein SDC9_203920 [bioreactor metagenome]|uniref:Uncharacterized protein n=1 Tax=bioreactor metagenome TaxID=1076179 RepID=A0A645J6Y8_9ZZZZ
MDLGLLYIMNNMEVEAFLKVLERYFLTFLEVVANKKVVLVGVQV